MANQFTEKQNITQDDYADISDERKEEISSCFWNETNELETEEWRNELTPREHEYVNSLDGDTTNGFEKLAKALADAVKKNEAKKENRPRLFVDMDGTLARFHDEVHYLERMFEKGFFSNLQPFQSAVDGIKAFIEQHPNIEVFILSGAVDGEPPYCKTEKHQWLDKYLPEIDKAHRIFTKVGQPKSLFIPDGIRKSDFLYDDYNVSLEQWEQDGGTGIKCKNNINHKGMIGKLWEGKLVENTNSAADICKELYSVVVLDKIKHEINLNGGLDMEINARITPYEGDTSLKATATVVFNGSVAVHGVKVVDGEKGLFVQMPTSKKDGQYDEVAFPVTAELREQINQTVLEAFNTMQKEMVEAPAIDTKITVSLRDNTHNNSVKAGGQIVLDDSLVISNVKVVEGKNGLFVQLPTYMDSNGEYQPIVNPINKEFYQQIQKAVIDKFNSRGEIIGNTPYKELGSLENLSHFSIDNKEFAKKVGEKLTAEEVKWSGKLGDKATITINKQDEASYKKAYEAAKPPKQTKTH